MVRTEIEWYRFCSYLCVQSNISLSKLKIAKQKKNKYRGDKRREKVCGKNFIVIREFVLTPR